MTPDPLCPFSDIQTLRTASPMAAPAVSTRVRPAGAITGLVTPAADVLEYDLVRVGKPLDIDILSDCVTQARVPFIPTCAGLH